VKRRLGPFLRKVLLVVLCLGTVSVYVGRVIRVYFAERSADTFEVANLERAIQLVPDNAELPHLLGLRLSASDQDDDNAIANLRKAVELNPHRARYWLDLAALYQVTSNAEKQNEALQGALDAEPGNPEVSAEAAQFFLVSGETGRALPLFKQALVTNPAAATNILPLCWRETLDAKTLLASVIPDSPELQLTFLRILAEHRETVAADQVWRYIVGAHKPFPAQLTFFYFDYLMKEREVASFDRDWHQLAAIAPSIQAYVPNENLIVNAGFEQPLLNSGFDWRHQAADYTIAGVDDEVAHSGGRSLSLSYDGGPAYDAGWTQFIPVQANAEYEFSAWIKSDNVTSSSGPRIAIADAYSGANLLLTDDALDTHSWQERKGSLRVPATAQLITVKIIRAPADTRIRGRIWIDDLRLVKK
jgi:tetratricopeptide (TPR) repeat protein